MMELYSSSRGTGKSDVYLTIAETHAAITSDHPGQVNEIVEDLLLYIAESSL